MTFVLVRAPDSHLGELGRISKSTTCFALRWIALLKAGDGDMTPADIQAMKAFIDEHRTDTTPFDIVWEGETPVEDREQDFFHRFAMVHVTVDGNQMGSSFEVGRSAHAHQQGPPYIAEREGKPRLGSLTLY